MLLLNQQKAHPMTKLSECTTREEVLAWLMGLETTNDKEKGITLTIFRCAFKPCVEQALDRMAHIAALEGAMAMREAADCETPDLPEKTPSTNYTTGFLEGVRAKQLAIRALDPAAVINQGKE